MNNETFHKDNEMKEDLVQIIKKGVEHDLTDAVRDHDFWEGAKLPDDLKVTITFGGTEYGDDCQVEVYRHTEDGASVSFEGKGAEDVPDYGDRV